MHLFGASSVRCPPMTAPAVATAANFFHIPSCYHYYHRHPLPPHRRLSLYHGFNFGFPPARRLDVSVSSLGKSRKKKSDSELCEEIREFLGSAGLPEGHVPSVKELSERGRNDLANLVRRRGYKVIAGLLLANSVETYNGKNDLIRNNKSRSEEIGEGHVEEEFLGKAGLDLPGNMVSSRKEQTLSAKESSLKDEAPKDQGDGNEILLPFGLPQEEEDYGSLNKDAMLDFGVASCVTEEISTDETLKRVAGTETGPSTSTGSSSVQENLSSLSKNHLASDAEIAYRKNFVSSATSSLDERVAKFMQSGYLEPVEDCVSDLLNDTWEKEDKTSAVQKNGPEYVMDGELKSSMKETSQNISSELLTELDSTNARDQITNSETFNGNLKSEGGESSWEEKQSDVEHLKLMLHQKELELAELKEQIQKEKNALELMQIKAENEISKAQKRIWEKDAELRAAEDSLAELKEVQIEYQGEGDAVEVAGSFNGWQGRITMDPLLPDSSTDSVGLRKPSLWSTTLWLYPGKYEIKFVVDGHWTIDPKKESVTRGTISNNIIRVDR